jgi:hypothetical protein
MADMRQEMQHADRHMEREHRRRGETIVWFEYINPVNGDLHPVYDEAPLGSGGRKYAAGVVVPAMWTIENEDERTPRPEGRQTVQSCQFVVAYRALERAGISQPWESTVHLRDIVYIDGRYYQLHSYVIHRGMQDDATLTAKGTEVYIDQEWSFSPGPAAPGVDDFPVPATFPPLP